MAVTATNKAMTGLPRRLVQDGIVAEEALVEALDGASEAGESIVDYLVDNGLADPQAVAVAASHEFGVPLFDLNAYEMDLDAIKSIKPELIQQHRVLPLMLRGKRLFLGVADPTNLTAMDEIKFASGFRIDPVVVEQKKLTDCVSRALEAVDTTMSGLDDEDFDLEGLEVSGGDELEEDNDSDVDDAPVVKFVNKVLLDAIKKGLLGYSLRALRKDLPRAHPSGRRAAHCRTAACATVAERSAPVSR